MTDTPPLDLDLWEAEAKAIKEDWGTYETNPVRDNERILALISELREERERLASAEEALKFYSHEGDFSFAPDIAREHLAKWGKE